ncbi:MAG TPA: nickel pincer cofactor biosynthesis protein LarC [Terriglobales bacterium]|nr:nickel pincer cofactor biosynthesis protein LarC [Terriglobales bacterium]
MRIAYLDCFSGISGDMFLGALLDAGVSPQLLEETVAALNIGARLEVSRVERSGISALKVDVYSHGEKDLPREEYWKQRSERHEQKHQPAHGSHDHRHAPVELLEHNYGASPSHDDENHDHPGRHLSEIREIILKSPIADPAKANAIAIFEALGAAEAKIHSTDIESVHFHEVGAVDAMVDIVCAAVGAHALNVDEIICSPLNVGGGTVTCAHGTLPVPAPATLELLKDAPIYSSGIQAELVTPTGAAIVKTLARRFSAFPQMTVEHTGYGAGTRDFPGHANVARLTIGESATASGKVAAETITVIEANLDDLNPQVFGYVMDRLLEAGALDAFAMPVQMKKNRPGLLLTVLCHPQDAPQLSQIIFAETTTLGVRQREEHRQTLARKWVTVSTQWGDVRMKIASMNGTITNYAPEYEDCRRIAADCRVPLKTVMQEAMQKYLSGSRRS